MRPRRKVAIDRAVVGLAQALGGVRPAVALNDPTLMGFFNERNYTAMLRVIRDNMGLHIRVRLGVVKNNAGPRAPAWITTPGKVHDLKRFGLKNTVVTVYIRRSLIQKGFEATVLAMAHELSHLVLDLIDHRWRHLEKAVDLTAMILGYRLFYVRLNRHARYGYFSEEEIVYAYCAIEYNFKRSGQCSAEDVAVQAGSCDVKKASPSENLSTSAATVVEKAQRILRTVLQRFKLKDVRNSPNSGKK